MVTISSLPASELFVLLVWLSEEVVEDTLCAWQPANGDMLRHAAAITASKPLIRLFRKVNPSFHCIILYLPRRWGTPFLLPLLFLILLLSDKKVLPLEINGIWEDNRRVPQSVHPPYE